MFTYLNKHELKFPNPKNADKDGLLAVGGDLSIERLLLAYSNGIFPWYGPDDPILWYAPRKRCVLYPQDIKISKSMKQVLRNKQFEIRINTAFEEVINACANTFRPGQDGTWIQEELIESFLELHKIGFALSVETWKNNELVGGLYGIVIGKIFCGESMFSTVANASKFAFIHLAQHMGFDLIDCQLPNPHLMSLGATLIPNTEYYEILKKNNILSN